MYFYEPADPQPCFYCKEIKEYENNYTVRKAKFTSEKIIFRCGWHAQFQCSKCGKFSHFSWLYYCPITDLLVCGNCNLPSLKPVRFWNKSYAYEFQCKACEEIHYDLLFAEFMGTHPWQLEKKSLISNIKESEPWKSIWKPEGLRSGRGISVKEALVVEDRISDLKNILWVGRFQSDFIPSEEVNQEEQQKSWEIDSKYWIEQVNNHLYLAGSERDIIISPGADGGDINRQFIIDPALWKLLGEVKGLTVLDAGCGNGYLTRQLAQKGAIAVGVDFSRTFIEYCKKKEDNENLGCKFIHASLTDLSKIESNTFDLIVSNIVMVDIPDYEQAFNELGRVIKPNGRFLWSNLHPVFAKHTSLELKLPSDTRRREERRYLIVDRYFESGGRQVKWFGETPLWLFDRTLSEYSKGLKKAGFVIREIVEPKASLKAMETYPSIFAFDSDRYPYFIIFDCLKI